MAGEVLSFDVSPLGVRFMRQNNAIHVLTVARICIELSSIGKVGTDSSWNMYKTE